MQVFELFFDSLYLSLVLFIGIRMLLIKDKSAPLLGAMTLLLGLGDSFHLIPRIISQVMDSGFDLNQGALFLDPGFSPDHVGFLPPPLPLHPEGKPPRPKKLEALKSFLLWMLPGPDPHRLFVL